MGDEFNTGIFVMQPSLQTHQEMLQSYTQSPPNYQGEEGFLNWFFHNRTTRVISARYNTVLRQKVHPSLSCIPFYVNFRIMQFGLY